MKKRFDPLFGFFRHPRSSFSHPVVVRITIALIALFSIAGASCALAASGAAQNASAPRARVFVIFTTVFTDQGFALPGARARVRRSDEKKFRWEGVSDRQGEVAFRVPPGVEYEVVIEARGFKPQTRTIDAREDNQADLTIRMAPQSAAHTEPAAGGKP